MDMYMDFGEGCSKKFEDRPIQCQTLLPTQTLLCRSEIGAKSKRELIEEWLPFIFILKIL